MHPQYDLFKQWAAVKRPVLEERSATASSCSASGSTPGTRSTTGGLPHYFFEFDIYDKGRRRSSSLETRLALLEGTGIQTVPVIHRGPLDEEAA